MKLKAILQEFVEKLFKVDCTKCKYNVSGLCNADAEKCASHIFPLEFSRE